MDLLVTVKIALISLLRNKMRSILTMLGMIIGVGSVVGMISIGEGANRSIMQNIESMGSNSIFISPSSTTKGGVRGGWDNITTLKVEDAYAIMKECKHIQSATPNIRTSNQIIYKNRNWSTGVIGANEHIFDIQNWKIESGVFFGPGEINSASKVCVLGQEVKKNLFDQEEAVGEIIRINKIPFKVIGVLEQKGASADDNYRDDVILIPYTTSMQRFYRQTHLQAILASATDRADTQKAVDEITDLLRQRHRIRTGADDDFEIFTIEELIKMIQEITGSMTLLLGSIAGVSLLVGGIGIMNIMLVSVTERIREIGIRMAIGAKQKDILFQFLVESTVLSLMGGFLGLVLGFGFSSVFAKITKWGTYIPPQWILIALGFSVFMGVSFGFYPALKASTWKPIDALKHT